MVHHEWRQRGRINVQKTVTIPSGWSVSRFHRYVSSSWWAPRSGEHPFPAAGRLVRFGGADADEAGEGRHPIPALKKITSARGRGYRLHHCYAKPHWSLKKTAEVVSFGSSTSYSLILTRIHRPAQLVISVPTPSVATSAGLWSAVCSVTFIRRCRACCTGCHWWWNRRLCSCWAGLAPAKGPSAPKSWRYERWREKGQWKLLTLMVRIYHVVMKIVFSAFCYVFAF